MSCRLFVATFSLGLVLPACTSEGPNIRVVVDLPSASSVSFPFAAGGVDGLRLAVAREGDDTDLFSTEAAVGDELELTDVPFGTNLVLHLYGEQAGAEVAYGRSCRFDFDADVGGPDAVHVYFSRLVQWGDGPQAVAGDRIGGHAFERGNESVVFAGGQRASELEVFNGQTGELSIIDEAPSTRARVGSVFANLGGDRSVIIGGVDDSSQPVATIEILPNLRDSLEVGLSLQEHAATGLVNGSALVVGGKEWDGSSFIATAKAWEIETDEGGVLSQPQTTASLSFARSLHSATRVSDDIGAPVLVAGGLDDAGVPVAAAEVYRPLARSFEPVLGTLTRWQHGAVRLVAGSVLIIGGFEPGATAGEVEPAQDLLLFDPIGGTFAQVGVLPDNAPFTEFTLTRLPDGRILLAGGLDSSGVPTAEAFIVRFDAINGAVDVVPTDSLAQPRAGHAAALLCDGTVLIRGGMSGQASPTERYNPTQTGRR